jgi:hypothetical protein
MEPHAGSENGPVIVPGSPDESRIIEVLTGGHFAQLSDDQLALLRQWIADGAPEGETTAEPEPTSEETPQPEPTLESEEPSEVTPEASPAGPAFSWGEVTPTPTEVTSEGFSWGD